MPDLSVGSGTSANPGRGVSGPPSFISPPFGLGDSVPMRSQPGPTPDDPSEAPWSITWQAVVSSERPVSFLPPPPPPPPSVCQTHFPPSLLLPWIFWCIKNKKPRLVWRGEVAGVAAWIEIFPLTFGAVSSATDPSPLGPDWSSRWLQWYLIYSRSAGPQLA